MSKEITLYVGKWHYEHLISGHSHCEIRYNDKNYKSGDKVTFRAVDDNGLTGHNITLKVQNIHSFPYDKEVLGNYVRLTFHL